MVLLTHISSIVFSISAGIFAVIEVLHDLTFLIMFLVPEYEGIPFFELVRPFVLVILVSFTIIIVAWETNRIVLSYFPYTVILEDVGEHLGIASRTIDERTKLPREDGLSLLLRRKGMWFEQKLQEMAFEVRQHYSVEEKAFSEIPITTSREETVNGFRRMIFDVNNAVIREEQVLFEFYLRRPKYIEPVTPQEHEFYCKIIVKYTFKFPFKRFGKEFHAEETVKVPSRIRYM